MKNKDKRQVDVFAEIAQQRVDSASRELIEPQPPPTSRRVLPLAPQARDIRFRPLRKMETAEELARELARQRKRHAPFLRSLVPELPQYRISLPLKKFDWRLEMEADLRDFPGTLAGDGKWERVTIPHYGGPLGRATAYYRATFELSKAMLKKGAVFARFKGVDYKAHVFVNGAFLGSHEGFFAPFEFEFIKHARPGRNTLLVKVENDAICMGNSSWGDDGAEFEGDKIYAATGPGYDDPEIGWHHCPPGMGIYQDVLIEARSPLHVHDLFVRPLMNQAKAEAWVHVWNCDKLRQEFRLRLSVVGQNFKTTLFSNREFPVPGPAGPGVNQYRFLFDMPDARLWDLETPWLYRIQATLMDRDGKPLDTASRQFGMRSFRMDVEHELRGRMYLNGREIRLRGANTMGFEQQDVMKRDWAQLVDDLLLAKICHMNYLRLTQRPVQEEVYEMCDRLGVLTQTDLPLFSRMRPNQFGEGVRQAGEMERLVRPHPCNIMVTYINEPSNDPFPWKPWRSMSRPELERFFRACDEAVRLENPDRVIKAVDGDYTPPGPGLPDNHCYSGWYTGHGLDLGKLHRGYWQRVKPGWMYACGEFGSEGLDPVNVMRKLYPSAWLPQTLEKEKTWRTDRIVKAQTGPFHYMWFDTQHSLEAWVAASHQHQAWVTRIMTEAFRRDNRMNSCAIHLFIDAFPSGWMKTIMDVERQPKPSYFAYREALTPLMVNLRTDRFAFFSGERMRFEAWICNDTPGVVPGTRLAYRMEQDGRILACGATPADVPRSASVCEGQIVFTAPKVAQRSTFTIRLALQDHAGKVLHDTSVDADVFPEESRSRGKRAWIVGPVSGKAATLARGMGLQTVFAGKIRVGDVILVDDLSVFRKVEKKISRAVKGGNIAVMLELPEGDHDIAETRIKASACEMASYHFVSRDTGHELVRDFRPLDFKFWCDDVTGYPSPLIDRTVDAPGWVPILKTGNGLNNAWGPALAVAEKQCGQGVWRVCQVLLAHHLQNPVAAIFARRLLMERTNQWKT